MQLSRNGFSTAAGGDAARRENELEDQGSDGLRVLPEQPLAPLEHLQPRSGDVVGEVAALSEREDRVLAAMEHERGRGYARQHTPLVYRLEAAQRGGGSARADHRSLVPGVPG